MGQDPVTVSSSMARPQSPVTALRSHAVSAARAPRAVGSLTKFTESFAEQAKGFGGCPLSLPSLELSQGAAFVFFPFR